MPDGMSVGNHIGCRGRVQGRGATLNPEPRYGARETKPFDDGWTALGSLFADLPPLPTTLIPDRSRTALACNPSPDLPFDRSVNPYRGCEHGCVYCYARPTHAYLGFSPGLDFETKVHFKPDVAEQLERELSRPGYRPRPVQLGASTDPYQPAERTLRLTRQVLEVLDRFNHPASIVTKGAGVLRDLDLLRRMAERGLMRAWISVTTLDGALARRMEPRAAAPARRVTLNDPRFGARMAGAGAYADALAKRFAVVVRRLGFEERSPLDAGRFAPPVAEAAEMQISLL